MKQKSGERTLLASVLLSSPGPIVVGVGLFLGRSSTQLADFIRRSAELCAIIVSWIIYKLLNKNIELDLKRKEKLEQTANLCVGIAMCISGIIMIFIAILSSDNEKGNVIPGLVIAILGMTTNSWFWLRYRKLNNEKPNAILATQSKLYFAKSLVDTCVTIALSFIVIAPDTPASKYVDLVGSIIVAIYLIVNGFIIIRSKSIQTNKEIIK